MKREKKTCEKWKQPGPFIGFVTIMAGSFLANLNPRKIISFSRLRVESRLIINA